MFNMLFATWPVFKFDPELRKVNGNLYTVLNLMSDYLFRGHICI